MNSRTPAGADAGLRQEANDSDTWIAHATGAGLLTPAGALTVRRRAVRDRA
ncbi:hypothetical protein GCM10010275_18960 [Streptomyces litmocidini]|uniref:hypothetical protein n=1 Tax=Streptomyces litmocidini TaxID=67318 RepID=UPI00167D8F81|nr:hypothetical protein [Streptomyces litmocidini]GGU83880.1 hypothetical protein GCM10010275_18960 [Streptomyces litmocidini]